jgi:hypothetical protein
MNQVHGSTESHAAPNIPIGEIRIKNKIGDAGGDDSSKETPVQIIPVFPKDLERGCVTVCYEREPETLNWRGSIVTFHPLRVLVIPLSEEYIRENKAKLLKTE